MKPLFAKVLSIAAAGALAFIVVPSAATASRSVAQGSPYKPSASQKVAALHANEATYKSPGGRRQGSVSMTRPITGERTVLPVLRTVKHSRATWLLVRLPGRPNSHTGWIHAAHTQISRISWHIVVATGPQNNGSFSNRRRVYVYNHAHLVKSWLVVTGAPGRVTPHGQFFVEENILEGRGAVGGPYALATSARSTTYSEFDGGPGQVALHGMDGGLYAKPGTAVSHGCVRLLDKEITWLASRIYPGTPVTIVG
ncbi:MAG: L,D-transpeptidase [Solirubrobacteraceae bacterium]